MYELRLWSLKRKFKKALPPRVLLRGREVMGCCQELGELLNDLLNFLGYIIGIIGVFVGFCVLIKVIKMVWEA